MLDEWIERLAKIDGKAKLVGELSDVTVKVLKKDPEALDNNIVQYYIEDNFGKTIFGGVKNLYLMVSGNKLKEYQAKLLEEEQKEKNNVINASNGSNWRIKKLKTPKDDYRSYNAADVWAIEIPELD